MTCRRFAREFDEVQKVYNLSNGILILDVEDSGKEIIYTDCINFYSNRDKNQKGYALVGEQPISLVNYIQRKI